MPRARNTSRVSNPIFSTVAAVALLCCGGSSGSTPSPTAPTPPTTPAPASGPLRYLSGNPADVAPPLVGPAHDLGGGGTDVDAAIQWMIDTVRGCTTCPTTLDVVVLRATGADGYNAPIAAMRGVDSVESIVIARREEADDPAIAEAVARAEVVFFAGGDQCDYVTRVRGTRVHTAVETVYARGGGIGGTSAGFDVLSEHIYDACTGSVLSTEALANPYDSRISLSGDFFHWDMLRGTLADTHMVTRDRLGRVAVFLARAITDSRATRVMGVAIDEGTSLVVDRAGLARVMGASRVYLMLADHPPDVCRAGQPLTFSNLRLWRLRPGDSFVLPGVPNTGAYERSIVAGKFDSDPY